MQLVANQQLVKNRVRLGTAFHLAALAIFAIGLVISLQVDATREMPIASWVAIAIGLVFYSLGQTQLRRWGPRHRQEEQLGQAIRGLDDRYKLYAFISSSLPDYILVSPAGVQVIIARHDSGGISCTREKWKKDSGGLGGLLGPGLGNPTHEAQRALQRIREALSRERLDDVPTSALIVFTHPKVQLRVEGCGVTVTRLKELKDVLRRAAGKGQHVALSSSRIREVQALFDRRMQSARAWR
jgi:hypothetical protein